MNVLVAGPDRGLTAAFEGVGATVSRVEGILTAGRLRDAGVAEADLFVLTDAKEATAIPLVHEENPEARIVAYSPDSLPEFVKGILDLSLDPALFDPEMVAEETAD